MANKKKSPWELSDQQYQEFQQAYINASDAAGHEQAVRDARDNAKTYSDLAYITPKWSERRIAMQNYEGALRNYETFMRLGGTVTQEQASTYQNLQNQYAQALDALEAKRFANRQGFGGLGMQTAAGFAPNGTQFDRESLSQHLKPGRGLIDFNTGYPTESNQRAAQENAMRTQYQNIQTEAGQESARWGQQAAAAQTDKERADYWLNIISGLPVTNDARIKTSND